MGITGTTTFDDDNWLLKEYRERGMDMKWEQRDGKRIKIRDMHPAHIKNCINMLNNKPPNDARRTWIKIFNDVILKQRALKLNKLINKIEENKKE